MNTHAIWKDIAGYEGIYQVNNFGKIKRLEYEMIRSDGSPMVYDEYEKQTKVLKNGYEYVMLNRNGGQKYVKVSRLVAEAFIPNPKGLREVNHINGDKLDNRVVNLEWMSHADNVRHRFKVLGKMTTSNRKIMCVETGEKFSSIQEAIRKKEICSCSLWKALRYGVAVKGNHWKYLDKAKERTN